ncbi:PilX N-terminal domain-containing pilus assembly protein [Ureibacillus manganicus]|uniref:Type 4 fimbrial biogenesis protein PilX N-terminal domain-containing protein n=1 Tax=Ureibacillus manganicus DSM 26584 TaxID=1384049 RepID=A0A0A3I4J8_9BACL|nr:PilX N-terminal domain-containing pilus assembly protein [Ureibacillus manganicus]KGR79654.1 hypothetical protein CD29_06030 [Ureibacillus manganicus DSM 26584]
MRKFPKVERNNNEQGFTLIIVILTVVIISIIGLSILQLSSFMLKTTVHERNDQTVYYIAESGLVEKKAILITEINRLYNLAVTDYEQQLSTPSPQPFKAIFLNHLTKNMTPDALETSTYTHYQTQFSQQPESTIKVDVVWQNEQLIYKLSSTGKINNNSRTVSQNIAINLNSIQLTGGGLGDFSKVAVYAKDQISLGYDDILKNIKGELASSTQNSIRLTNGQRRTITYDPKSFNLLIESTYKSHLNFDSKQFENATYIPNYSPLIRNNKIEATWNTHHDKTLSLTGNLKIDKMSVGNNMNFTLDVGNSDKILYVDDLSLAANLHIIGTGNLTIFVKNNLQFQYANINLSGATNKLKLYYAGDSKVTIADGLKLNADLYIKDADLQISGGAGFTGNIYSNGVGTVQIDGGSINENVLLFMPNYDITLTGGATLNGTLLCNNFLITGGARIDGSAGGGLQNAYTIEKTDPVSVQPLIET